LQRKIFFFGLNTSTQNDNIISFQCGVKKFLV